MKRNKFSLSNYKLLTCDMGQLIPVNWFEVLPGDTVQAATAALIRCTPLLSPVMHPVRVRLHHFFVPNRLIWEDWEDFITGGEDGLDDSEWPYKTRSAPAEGSLCDYLGVPPGSYSPGLQVSALPYRAYALIYNEFYRDQDLCSEAPLGVGSGSDSTTEAVLRTVSWEKDYFTASRPWETKGVEVTIPIGDQAPVTGIGTNQTTGWSAGPTNAYETDGSGAESYADYKIGDSNNFYFEEDPDNAGYPNIRADLAAATGVNINELRLGLALQRYQEARARYGARYVEYLRYLGVRSSDGRLQLPEYLGGGRQTIQFSEVLVTSDEGTATPGDMKGHGIGAMRTNRYRRFMEEHGIVMTLLSVVPKAIYTQAMHKKWFRQSKEDYYQKELQFLGDQAILNKEVYSEHSEPDDVFGYQGRFDDYRYNPSSIAGEFRSTLNHWHYARIHSGDVSLNSSFIECVPTKRVNASQSTDVLMVMANNSIQVRRNLIRRATPRTF